MTRRCKMTCTKSELAYGEASKPGDGFKAEFVAVSDGSPENDAFFQATPAGELSLQVTHEQYFEQGKSYYIDITLVE